MFSCSYKGSWWCLHHCHIIDRLPTPILVLIIILLVHISLIYVTELVVVFGLRPLFALASIHSMINLEPMPYTVPEWTTRLNLGNKWSVFLSKSTSMHASDDINLEVPHFVSGDWDSERGGDNSLEKGLRYGASSEIQLGNTNTIE